MDPNAAWLELMDASTSFVRDDLPLVIKVGDQAHYWIFTVPSTL